MIDLAGCRVVTAVRGPTHVAVMGTVDGVEHELVVVENRRDDGDIGEVATAEVRIVQDKQIALGNVLTKIVAYGLPGRWQGADVHGNAFALGHQLAVSVENGGGKVPTRVEDLRHRGAQHDLSHFQRDGAKAMLHHGERDGVRLCESHAGHAILGEHVEPHLQLNAAVGIHPGGIAGFDHDGGKRRFEERRTGNFRARGELVRSIHWHLTPRAEVDAPLPLQGQRRAAIGALLR